MLEFAERVGWKMQKRDEELVTEFCNEVGVDKGVLKVWMHNNKNTFGKRDVNGGRTSLDDNNNNNNENENDNNTPHAMEANHNHINSNPNSNTDPDNNNNNNDTATTTAHLATNGSSSSS